MDTVKSNNEQKVYGFKIVIFCYLNNKSRYILQNAKLSKFDDIGYYNFINSLVV